VFHSAAQVGTPLFAALTELKGELQGAQRTLTFTACSRKRPLRKLKPVLVAQCEDLKVMNIRRDAETATITMTDIGFRLITDAVGSWLAGAEDFGVSPRNSSLKPKQFGRLDRESGELWFWGPFCAGP
jgi:hypothetical protein